MSFLWNISRKRHRGSLEINGKSRASRLQISLEDPSFQDIMTIVLPLLSVSDLLYFSMTSKFVYHLAIPYLYKTVTLRRRAQFQDLFTLLKRQPYIVSYIKELEVKTAFHSSVEEYSLYKAFNSIDSPFGNLEKFHWETSTSSKPVYDKLLPMLKRSMPNLKDIHILVDVTHSLANFAVLCQILEEFPRLSGLSFNFVLPDIGTTEDVTRLPESFWSSVDNHDSLTRLRIDGISGGTPNLVLPPSELPPNKKPRLQVLHISYRVLSEDFDQRILDIFLTSRAPEIHELSCWFRQSSDAPSSSRAKAISHMTNITRFSGNLSIAMSLPYPEKVEYLDIPDIRYLPRWDYGTVGGHSTDGWMYGDKLRNVAEMVISVEWYTYHEFRLPGWRLFKYIFTSFKKLEHLTVDFPVILIGIEETWRDLVRGLRESQSCSQLQTLKVRRDLVTKDTLVISMWERAESIFRIAPPTFRLMTIQFTQELINSQSTWTISGEYERLNPYLTPMLIGVHEVEKPFRNEYGRYQDGKSVIRHLTRAIQL